METNEFAHKKEIVATRVGCVGSSDAKMLMQIDTLGQVPQSAKNRMAVIKGIVEPTEISSQAIEYGNIIEAEIFKFVSFGNDKYISNPRWESERYSRKNVKCIAHPDIVFVDDKEKVIHVYEVKTSRHTAQELKREYRAQLFYQSLVAKEIAEKFGKKWRVEMNLVHYETDGLDLSVHNEFDANRLVIYKVVCRSGLFNLGRAMDIVNEFLEGFEGEKGGDVIDAQYLPADALKQFQHISTMLREIKSREQQVEEFKSRLYDFLKEKGITKIKCDEFSFTLVQPSKQASFDAKGWWEDYASTIDEGEADAIRDKYTRTKEKKGYVLIKVSNN